MIVNRTTHRKKFFLPAGGQKGKGFRGAYVPGIFARPLLPASRARRR